MMRTSFSDRDDGVLAWGNCYSLWKNTEGFRRGFDGVFLLGVAVGLGFNPKAILVGLGERGTVEIEITGIGVELSELWEAIDGSLLVEREIGRKEIAENVCNLKWKVKPSKVGESSFYTSVLFNFSRKSKAAY